jgi:hypothetical protein
LIDRLDTSRVGFFYRSSFAFESSLPEFFDQIDCCSDRFVSLAACDSAGYFDQSSRSRCFIAKGRTD